MTIPARSAWIALALAACTTAGPAPGVTGAEFCTSIREQIGGAARTCCGSVGISTELQAFLGTCDGYLGPLVDDPRTGFDAAVGMSLVDAAAQDYGACLTPARSATLADLRALFPGTLGIGTTCGRGMANDLLAQLSCTNGYCSADGATPGVCTPFAVEGSACTRSIECGRGLYCSADVAAGIPTGACMRPLALGSHCRNDGECLSSYCPAGTCADVDPTRPQTICATPPAVTDRDVDLTLVGFPPSATRHLDLLVLDASGSVSVSDYLLGVPAPIAVQHVPRALAADTIYSAQITTSDPSDAVPETRTWELAIPAGTGTVALTVDLAAATMPLSTSVPPSFDTTFDIQTFDFDPEIGHPFALRVVDVASGRTATQARLDTIGDIAFEIMAPNAIVPGRVYEIGMYVDQNGDDVYQPPPIDHAWRVRATAPTNGGLSIPFMWSTGYQDVGF